MQIRTVHLHLNEPKLRWTGTGQFVAENLIGNCVYIVAPSWKAFLYFCQPRPLFYLFSIVSNNILQKKTVGFSKIQTWIVIIEGEHADH